MKFVSRSVRVVATVAGWAAGVSPAPAAPAIRLIGVSQADQSVLGLQGDAAAYLPALSADGRYVAFGSEASTLVAGDTNGGFDVFWRDLATNVTRRVSVTAAGAQVTGSQTAVQTISEDGRFVAFATLAPGLVPSDTDTFLDVFVHDTQDGSLEHVNVSNVPGSEGHAASPSISANGRYVAFVSSGSDQVAGDSNPTYDVFVRDLQLGTTVRASVADGTGAEANSYSTAAEISRDGSRVTFLSRATNLVAGDSNNRDDVFVRTLATGATIRVSVGDAGQQASSGASSFSASPSATYIVFTSEDGNLVPGDTNAASDIFLRNTATNSTIRVSVGAAGEANGSSFEPSISDNAFGQHVAFLSVATNLVGDDSNGARDVFVRRVDLGTTVRASLSDADTELGGDSRWSTVARLGRYVAFVNAGGDAVPGDTNVIEDVFVRDLAAGTTVRASLADASGPFPAQATGESYAAVVSDGGRHVAFLSDATNLLPGDGNGFPDAFLRDTVDGSLVRASLTDSEGEANSSADSLALTRDGARVVFESVADNLVTGDSGGYEDVFVRDVASGVTTRVGLFGQVQPDGDTGGISASADGRFVAFISWASNFPGNPAPAANQVYVTDTQSGAVTRASVDNAGNAANAHSNEVAISDDGRYVAFSSRASNLSPADNSATLKVFRRDLSLGLTELVSVAASNPPADFYSDIGPRGISGDGRYVAFDSAATNLVVGDSNSANDVFVRDMVTGTTTRLSVGAGGQQASRASSGASISSDGRFVTFDTDDIGLTGDAARRNHVLLRDLLLGTTQRVSTDAQGSIGNESSGGATIARDGRNVSFSSLATNWTLHSGGQNPAHGDAFVAQLVEATTTAITTAAPNPSAQGQSVTVNVMISASDSSPRGSAVVVNASSGESCLAPAPTPLTATSASTSCTIAFATLGTRTLTATWPGTANYTTSLSAPLSHSVTQAAAKVFGNGFEGP